MRRERAPQSRSGPGVRAARVALALALALAAGTARSQGGPTKPPARPPPPVAVTPPPDAAIARRLEGVLSALGGIDELHVAVDHGVVRLGGRADELAARDQAIETAERVEGVVAVRSDIEVGSTVRTRVTRAWNRLTGYGVMLADSLPTLAVALIAFLAFAAASRALGSWGGPTRLTTSPLAARLARDVFRAVLVVSGLVVALDILGVVAIVGAVVGTLGLIGIVAGIAFKDVVANYLPGFMLGVGAPFAPGDRVKIGEHEGKIVRVTARETVLVTIDGEHLRLPNTQVLQSPIVNVERYRERRLRVTLDVALEADLRRVRDVGRDALLAVAGILAEPPPILRVMAIAPDRVSIQLLAWADQEAESFRDTESGARRAVKEALLDAGVPFPVDEIVVTSAEARPALAARPPGIGVGEIDGQDEALVEDRVRAELADPSERDLLREGRGAAAPRAGTPPVRARSAAPPDGAPGGSAGGVG